jgi:hypothetical protein
MSAPVKTPRFLDLYYAGEVPLGEIDDYIEAWHASDHHVQLHVFLGLTWAEFRTWLREHWLPTAAEHAAESVDAVWMGLDDPQGYLFRVHPPQHCQPPCPIHWPSDHALAGAPMWWDAERGLLERSCQHLVFHPDPDDRRVRRHPELRDHPCDGCCRPRASCVADARGITGRNQ